MDQYCLYVKAMNEVHAREILLDMKIADYPNLREKDRKNFHRDVYRRSGMKETARPVTTAQLAFNLGLGEVNG